MYAFLTIMQVAVEVDMDKVRDITDRVSMGPMLARQSERMK